MAAPVVKKVTSGNVSRDVTELMQQLGGIGTFVHPGERVLIKPACNSPFGFPATTDLNVIATVVQLVRTVTDRVAVGDSSGFIHKPTQVAFDGTGLTGMAAQMGFPLIDFDAHEWETHRDSRATRLREVRLTSRLADFDRLIFLPTMRTHAWARITMALKLGMGFVPVPDRKQMHRTALEEMLGELNLYFRPDIVILDGRKCFVNGGPDSGDERSPGVLLASTGRVAIDTAAVEILQNLGAYGLEMPASDVPMIRTARELGID